jgi:SAM-dependent methyltransferase
MAALSRQYVKLCDVADFKDELLAATIAEIRGGRTVAEMIERKDWEMGMTALALGELGHLHEGSRILSVAAGIEPILYWLTNRVGAVVAVDLYGEGKFVGHEAQATMLEAPETFSPVVFRKDRLEVRHMDAMHLDFPDGSFDAVYSLSSIEHFGSAAAVAKAMREIARVLRPGGHAVIVTECLLRLHPRNWALVDLAVRLVTGGRKRQQATLRRRVVVGEAFTPKELRRTVVEPSGLRLVQPLDLTVSDPSWENLAHLHPDGSVTTPSGEFSPHIVAEIDRSAFTSVCLVLEKPG